MMNTLNLFKTAAIAAFIFSILLGLGSGVSAKESDANKRDVLKNYGNLPMRFEANVGQTDAQVKFISRGSGYTMFLTSDEAVMVLSKPVETDALLMMGEEPHKSIEAMMDMDVIPEPAEPAVLRMKLLGANSAPAVTGLKKLPGITNYFIGNDPNKWHTNVPSYAKVEYKEVYEGIDLVYYGNQRQLEFDFVVAPGADPNLIKLDFEGAERLEIDEEGDLVIHVAGGELRQYKPVIYQEIDGEKKVVSGGYVLDDARRVTFELGDYDASKSLIIDPILSYSTYLGGSNFDVGKGIAVDGTGSAYVTGGTFSADFPTANPFQGSYGGGVLDAFVTKLDASGSALVYSTYLGGSWQDIGQGIAVDGFGSVYVVGFTESANFPTANPFQGSHGGGTWDVFVTKLDPSGSVLEYSTYLGGNLRDFAQAIAVDGTGSAYVTGNTASVNFPTENPFQGSYGGGLLDAFVTKLDPSGSALEYSTYLGGSSDDFGWGIAVDGSGNAYVTGETWSSDFPTKNPFQGSIGGGPSDAFVTKLNFSGSALVYSTYLGGSNFDDGRGIAVDGTGSAYVTGFTFSTNFPTANALQSSNGGDFDVFVTKLDPSGSALEYSTYLGGSQRDFVLGIALDNTGSAYVTGQTASTDFPTSDPIQGSNGGNWDVFVTKLDPSGSALEYSTYLGGSTTDYGRGIAVDGSGNAYVTGRTISTDFPTANPFQGSSNGGWDVLVAKIGPANAPPVADAGLDQIIFVGQTVQLDGAGSSDPDGDPLTYSWSIISKPVGSISTLTGATAVDPSFAPDLSGDYVVELVVNDGTVDSDPDHVTITAQTAQEVAQDVINQVDELVASGSLNRGQGNALTAVLDNAIQMLDRGNTNAAINQLGAFISQVNALINVGVLSSAEGEALINAAQDIIDHLNGLSKDALTGREGIPDNYALSNNFPNPFNPETRISFALSEAGFVKMIIYDQLGREVTRLVDGHLGAGYHDVTWNASNAASGMYFYRLQAGEFTETRKMILLK